MSHFFGVLFLLSFLTQFCVYGFHGVLIVLCWGKFYCSGLVRCPEEKARSLRDDYVVTAWQLEVLPCWSQNLWGKLSRSPQCLPLQCSQCRKFHTPFRLQFTFFFSFKMGEFSQQLDMSFSSKYLEDVIPKVANQSNFDSNAYYEKVNSWSWDPRKLYDIRLSTQMTQCLYLVLQ